MFKNFDIAVDTTKGIRNQAISVNTNDLQTLQFSFIITQSGVPVNLTGATVRLAVKKPDKKTVFQDCTITDAVKGKCEIILDTQAYIVPGLHPVELMIYYAADKVSVTGRFSYTANKGILDDSSVVSTNEFQSINKAITDVESIVVDLRDNGTGIDAQARSELETVTTQLADTGQHIGKIEDKANSQVMQKSTRKVKATFVDDDGSALVYTKLKPLVEELQFKVTSALVTANVNKGALTENQIKELYNTGLYEFVSHTKTHKYLADITEDEQIEELRASKEWLRERGYTHDILVYPYGSTSSTVRKNAKKFYRAGVFIDDTYHKVNYPPLTTFNIERVYVDYGLDLAKQKIDEAIANNGWIVFGMHCWYENWSANDVRGIVNYLREKNVDIITLSEGIDMFGNVIEIGDSSNLSGTTTQIIDCDGNTHGSNSPQVVFRGHHPTNFNVKNDSPVSFFPIGKTTITNIGTGIGLTNGFPSDVGVLITEIYTNLSGYPYAYQEFRVSNSEKRYRRYWDSTNNVWKEWVEENFAYVYLTFNSVTPSTPLSNFRANKTTLTYINNSGATGFPSNTGGTLITHNTGSGWGYQHYKMYNTERTFIRHSKSDGSWGEWLENLPQYYKIQTYNTYTNSSLITDFPSNSVTTITVNTSGATGFPSNSAGTLTTWNITNGYGRQEYRLYQSNSVYGRYINSSGVWSAWEKISAV